MIHEINPACGRLTKSHVHALNKGAVITQPLHFNNDDFHASRYKPGDMIEMTTEDEAVQKLLCRILDIESVKVESEARVSLRITLEKAE